MQVCEELYEALAVQQLFCNGVSSCLGWKARTTTLLPSLTSSVYIWLRNSRTNVYSQDLSNLSRALVSSSAASYRFAEAFQAFFRCGVALNSCSLFLSLDKLCQMDIETSGAHSLRTMPQSKLWKACMMKRRMCLLMVHDKDGSRLMERIRRNSAEKSDGRSLKIPDGG